MPYDMYYKFSNLVSYFFFFLLLGGCKTNSTASESILSEGLARHHLENGMVIDVLLPPVYDESEAYPVLLVNDGELIFSSSGWNMQPLLYELIQQGEIEPIITVAIHTGGNRNNWYIPYRDTWVTRNWGSYTPEALTYATALFEDVLPFLGQQYSIDNQEVGMIGASLGGLIATWIGLNFPEQVKYSASLSGSFWIANHQLFSEVKDAYDTANKFWFDIGTAEWNYYVPLYRALEKAGSEPGKSNFYYEIPDGAHTVPDWRKRMDMPLKIFWGDTETSLQSMNVELECIPSASTPGLKFRRMNPIVTLTNGVKYSLAHTATYRLIGGEAELGTEGSFKNNPNTKVVIEVMYEGYLEEVVVPIGWCR